MEYTFINTNTDKLEVHTMKISEYDEFKKNNPHLERYLDSVPAIASGRGGDIKTDNTWKEVLSKVAEKHPGSPLADQVRTKSVKEVKTKEAIKRHVKRQAGRA
jgi:hypothetical protein